MKENNTSKIVLLVVLAAVIIFGVFLFQRGKWSKPQTEPEQIVKQPDKVEEVGAEQSLAGFPNIAILPLPDGTVVLNSYKTTSPDGGILLTKFLESRATLKETFDYFKGIFSGKRYGWIMVSDTGLSSTSTSAALFAKNYGGTLSVSLDFDQKTGKTLINLNFSPNKK